MMAKKGNKSVVNLGAAAAKIIDINKRILGSKIGGALTGGTGGSLIGAAAGSRSMTEKKGK
jgi:hypothetical protein